MVRSLPAIRETGWIDYILSAMLGSLALYCCGQGIAQPAAGLILVGLYSLGTAFSFVVGTKLRQTRFAVLDGPVYALAAAVAVFGQPFLSQLLPSETFPPELWSAGLLAWLLCLGSFAGWRDATRLFQAVPAIALFGLIGIYDTYPAAPFIFFGFLLCLALMFGRAHARAMLVQASRSGFSRIEEGLSLSEAGAEQDSMLRAMRRGPWRWMAGPEWAVASAGAVILVSMFGAPIIKDSVQGVAGLVRISLPPRLQRQAQNAAAPLTPDSLQRLGMGPRRLTNTVVGVAELDRPRYLRTQVFEVYANGAWSQTATQSEPTQPGVLTTELALIEEPREFRFEVSMIDGHWAEHIPTPQEIQTVTDPPGAVPSLDGTINIGGQTSVQGISIESTLPLGVTSPEKYLTARPNPREVPIVTPRVHAIVESLSHAKNDYAKANALVSAITQHAKYNLKAAAVPTGADPIDYFLFTSHEGYCDLFASAMVVLARDAGMDARFVIGYTTESSDRDESGRYILRQSDAHAWAEIYFNGIGWVIFDPTIHAENITPVDQSDMARLTATWVPVAGAVALVAGLVYYVPRLRLTLRLPVAAKRQRKLDRLYGLFAKSIGKTARMRKPPSATPSAWIHMNSEKLGQAAENASKLNAEFERALYSPKPPTDEDLNELASAVKDFKRGKH